MGASITGWHDLYRPVPEIRVNFIATDSDRRFKSQYFIISILEDEVHKNPKDTRYVVMVSVVEARCQSVSVVAHCDLFLSLPQLLVLSGTHLFNCGQSLSVHPLVSFTGFDFLLGRRDLRGTPHHPCQTSTFAIHTSRQSGITTRQYTVLALCFRLGCLWR